MGISARKKHSLYWIFLIGLVISLLSVFTVSLGLFPHEGWGQEEASSFVSSQHEQAVILARQGEFEKALTLIEQAFKKAPTNSHIVADYVVILSWSQNWQKAIELFERQKGVQWPDYVLPAVAKAYRVGGHIQKATELSHQYFEKYPDDDLVPLLILQSY